MRKTKILCISLVFLAALSPAFSQGLKASAGAATGLLMAMNHDYDPMHGMPGSDALTFLSYAGGFFDFTYGRVTASYLFNVTDNVLQTPSNTRMGFFAVEALAKLPVKIGDFSLWSGIGAKFVLNLFMDFNGDGIPDTVPDAALYDFFITMAIGCEFTIEDVFKLSPGFTIDYGLTPSRFTVESPDAYHTSILYCFSLTAGFVF